MGSPELRLGSRHFRLLGSDPSLFCSQGFRGGSRWDPQRLPVGCGDPRDPDGCRWCQPCGDCEPSGPAGFPVGPAVLWGEGLGPQGCAEASGCADASRGEALGLEFGVRWTLSSVDAGDERRLQAGSGALPMEQQPFFCSSQLRAAPPHPPPHPRAAFLCLSCASSVLFPPTHPFFCSFSPLLQFRKR